MTFIKTPWALLQDDMGAPWPSHSASKMGIDCCWEDYCSSLGQSEHQALCNLQQKRGFALLQFAVKRQTKLRETLKMVDESNPLASSCAKSPSESLSSPGEWAYLGHLCFPCLKGHALPGVRGQALSPAPLCSVHCPKFF